MDEQKNVPVVAVIRVKIYAVALNVKGKCKMFLNCVVVACLVIALLVLRIEMYCFFKVQKLRRLLFRMQKLKRGDRTKSSARDSTIF